MAIKCTSTTAPFTSKSLNSIAKPASELSSQSSLSIGIALTLIIPTTSPRLDRNNLIICPMMTMPGHQDIQTIATEQPWNRHTYACYLCTRKFARLGALNSHLRSLAHAQNIYQCPDRGCHREYKLLSGLVQHVESESWGLMQFAQVQRHARNGIENMVGRMIMN
ncbi:hypothetical protein BUE80_DR001099 [Diplocarpon rosae]|nr:hypothetical protein BUE80_DR001099 [Diplocarpon rosae]